MNIDTGTDYMSPWKLDTTIDGGGVGVILKSKNSGYTKGEVLEGFHWPWQLYVALDVQGFNCLIVNKVSSPDYPQIVMFKAVIFGTFSLTMVNLTILE